MTTLTITRGLPGSGKTTWATFQQAEAVHYGDSVVRVNRDDLRVELYGDKSQDGYYAHPDRSAREKNVTKVQHARIKALLEAGVDVICDDTNLVVRRCRELMRIAEEAGAEFEVADFSDVPLEECIRRQAGRPEEDQIPAYVILCMYETYLRGGLAPLPATSGLSAKTHDYSIVEPYDPPGHWAPKYAYVIDIDGTVAQMNGRGPHDYHLVGTDLPIPDVVNMVRNLNELGYTLIFLSGRKDDCRAETEAWLVDNGIPYDMLLMRYSGDARTDWIVKYELFNTHVRYKYNVVGVFDDRVQVLKMWETLGLTTFRVGGVDGGNF